VGVPNELTEFSIKAITEGIDAQGDVTVRIRHEDKTYVGRGADTDIVVASAKALMNALNRLLAVQRPADTEVRTSP
jgi:2-isopropylmalate synthase